MRKKLSDDLNCYFKRERLERLAQKETREIEVFLASRDPRDHKVLKEQLGSRVTKDRCCSIT